MDMKRILQAMDGVATKPVAGANDMAKFLSIVDKNAKVEILNEGSNPHKVSLPVQMAMQHYQKKETPVHKPVGRESTLGKYFHQVEEEIAEDKAHKRQLINQYASIIAERVRLKESMHGGQIAGHKPGFTGGVGAPGVEVTPDTGGHLGLGETPIDFNKDDPMGSTIYSHQGVNPASIRSRMLRASKQIAELAEMAKSEDPRVWQHLANLFPELAMNVEQVRHGIEELAGIKSKGGRRTANIPSMKENIAPKPKKIKPKSKTSVCKAGQTQTGVQTKNGITVPKCSVTRVK
jgi:hypothetical protein